VVANGKVYVAAVGKLSVYGLLNAGIRAVTSTALTSSPNPSTAGQAVTLTATVTSTTSGTQTGTVTFFDGTTSLGTGSLSASGMATLQVTFQSAGTHSITAQYGGDGNFTGSTSPGVAQTVNSAPSDFSIAASRSSASVNPGGVASFTLTLNTIGGYTGTVSLSCSGAPPASSCTAAPSSVTPNANNSATATVQIATSAAGSVGGPPPSKNDNQWTWLSLSTLATIAAIGLRRRRVLGLATAIGLLFIAGCGNGGVIGGTQQQATPSGTYTLTVTATAGTTIHNTTVQLKVN
jgi:hypothetical protein